MRLGMAISRGVAFLTDASGNQVVGCAIADNGGLSYCAPQGDATIFNYPYDSTIRDDVAYVPNRAEASITVCDVNGKALNNCAKHAKALFDGPTFVIFDDTPPAS
ncbi:MAG: hypothetical protein ABI629_24900 [bacterium]